MAHRQLLFTGLNRYPAQQRAPTWPRFYVEHRRFNSTTKYFDKILIANRGEIACRIIKTARRLGIKTVAIHSEVDANAKHVKLADETFNLGGQTSAESYLRMDKVLDAVKKTGAQAVHPGYGFLSENAKFAALLEENGVAWVGPPSSAILAMGDKIASKKLARGAGVHTIPGKLSEAHNDEEVFQMIKEIGYPVMIKASSGGGGKGMRVAWNDEQAREGFRLSKTEAKSAFGDDRILIEKFIDQPRHIEIQILGDAHGNTLYLNERECSIQRRNQKVLEEAPSSFIDPATRKAMGEQAVALAKAVGYRSAGTVEFLVDPNKNFYFLEMNTRLQVEHPVTEYITGLDLVEQMIRVAAGKKLEITQDKIGIKGWAMEARVYAEDPLRGFLPSIGTLHTYKEPIGATTGDLNGNVRCDSGILEGDPISIYYDPLISKLIGYGKDRKEAIANLGKALDGYVIRGLNHNVNFIRATLEHPRYISGNISTKFIPEEYPQGYKGFVLSQDQMHNLVASTSALHLMRIKRNQTLEGQLASFVPTTSLDLVVTLQGKKHSVQIQNNKDGSGYSVVIDGKNFSVSADWPIDTFLFNPKVNSKELNLQYFEKLSSGYRMLYFGNTYDVIIQTPKEAALYEFMPKKSALDMSKFLVAPMPGRVASVAVKPGDTVNAGMELCVIEAMKMQNMLRATQDGKVKTVSVKQGQTVAVDEVLIEFESK